MSSKSFLNERLMSVRRNLALNKDREKTELDEFLKSRKYKISIYVSWFILSFTCLVFIDANLKGRITDEIVNEVIQDKSQSTPAFSNRRFNRNNSYSSRVQYFIIISFNSGKAVEALDPNPYHTPRKGDTVGIEYSKFLHAAKNVKNYKWDESHRIVDGIFGFYFFIAMIIAVIFSILNLIFTKKGYLRLFNISSVTNGIFILWLITFYFK